MRSSRFLPLLLVLGVSVATCAPSDDPDALDTLLEDDSSEPLQPGADCTQADVCPSAQARPQCLAAANEARFRFRGAQTFDVPRAGQYSFLRVVVRRFFPTTGGVLRAEVREFAPGSTDVDAAIPRGSATLVGTLIPMAHGPVTLKFEPALTLGTANAATPRYVLVFSADPGATLSVGLACADDPAAFAGGKAFSQRTSVNGATLAAGPWKGIARDVSFAFGLAPAVTGTCSNTAGATCDDGNTASGDGCSATCQPESGYACGGVPSTCNSVDDCAGNGCLNGATCVDGLNSYTCACAAGYSGPRCATNIDDCAPNPCQNGGACTDGIAGFTCACASGYSGTTCTTNDDDCAATPCQNGGVCTDGVASFTCACASGYSGTTCGTNINDCAPNPCQNGGSCTDGIASFTCACATGFTGTTCSTNINDCSPNPCQNGGTCTDGIASYTCACPTGYAGATCSSCATGYGFQGSICVPQLVSEAFAGLSGGTSATQCTTGATVYTSGSFASWTKAGTNAVYVLQRAAGNYSAQFYDASVLTLTTGVAANVSGRHYRVAFDASATVSTSCAQSTGSGAAVIADVLRTDDSVLATYTYTPPAWTGASDFTTTSFGYTGDGTGNVRLRFRDSATDTRFGGAIDNVGLFLCPAGTAGAGCTRTAQTITWAQPSGAWLSDGSATLGGSSSSGLALIYTSSTPSICSIGGTNGDVVNYLAVGTCTITASQVGNATYAPADAVTRTFTVSGVSATGGTITNITVGGLPYRVHTFTAGNPFVVSKPGTVEYLVIGGGGGGGGGYNHCGGGGAGGLREGSLTVTATTYTITVGGGGTGATSGRGGQGGDSIFSSITATGGGGGCAAANQTGANGGSGGGGCALVAVGGTGVSGQGNNGGQGSSANLGGQDSGAGGGGGAGGVGGGTGGFTNSPGPGGQGLQRDITGTLSWYAAGGTGAGYYAGDSTNGIGGATPGRNQSYTAATAGAANTGSGGGGGRAAQQWIATSATGGAGGSGIVVIRYRTP